MGKKPTTTTYVMTYSQAYAENVRAALCKRGVHEWARGKCRDCGLKQMPSKTVAKS